MADTSWGEPSKPVSQLLRDSAQGWSKSWQVHRQQFMGRCAWALSKEKPE